MVEIHLDIINQFIEFNENQKNDSYDYGFALAALVSVVPPSQMACGDVNQDAMDFALGII